MYPFLSQIFLRLDHVETTFFSTSIRGLIILPGEILLGKKNLLHSFYRPFRLNIRIDINSLSIFFADDCPNCVDEHSGSLAASRWTMPLLKLGEKRYYLGIFFKVSLLPVTLIYLTEPSTRSGSRTLSNYFRARNFPALLSRTVLRCIECWGVG